MRSIARAMGTIAFHGAQSVEQRTAGPPFSAKTWRNPYLRGMWKSLRPIEAAPELKLH